MTPLAQTLNLRNVDEKLMRALKVEAAKRGITLRELVLSTLEGLNYGEAPLQPKDVQGVPEVTEAPDEGKLQESTETRDTVARGPAKDLLMRICAGDQAAMNAVKGVAEETEIEDIPEVPQCPEDGDDMVYNVKLKLWMCKCGFQQRHR